MADKLTFDSEISIFDFLKQRVSTFQQAANDARSLIRTNLLIIGFFLPVIATLFSGELPLETVFNNPYTQVGLVVWVLSTAILVGVYRWARTVASNQFVPIKQGILGEFSQEERLHQIQDKISEYDGTRQKINWLLTICMGLSLIATSLFALGLLLPYVSIIPQIGVFSTIVAVIIVSVIAGISLLISRYVVSLYDRYQTQKKAWPELTKPRQDLFKKLYVTVGEDKFQLSDLPLKTRHPFLRHTIDSIGKKESHVLLRDISEIQISEYLLDELVEEGYFEKEGEVDDLVIRDPYSPEEIRIDQADKVIKAALDRLGRELDSNPSAQASAASELGVRTEDVFDELRSGDALQRIERYHRVLERLKEEDIETSARRFEFVSEDVTYVPTDLSEGIYERLEHLEEKRILEREQAKRNEKIRKSNNTYLYLIVDPVDEHGNFVAATNGLRAPKGAPRQFNIHEADISEEERDQLRDLEEDDEIRLQVETHPQTYDEYIASVGGPEED